MALLAKLTPKLRQIRMNNLPKRDKLILAGLFLSKFDQEGLQTLGFNGFVEAFNAFGYALGGKPSSIKNYRDEFDPFFPNPRKGWHIRPLRNHCRNILDLFGQLSLTSFAEFLTPLTNLHPVPPELLEIKEIADLAQDESSFAKRLITGVAAEHFFQTSFPSLTEFEAHTLTNVSQHGCGFDFRADPSKGTNFCAIEVKGLSGVNGGIMMTAKEHRVANHLRERYFLCVVRNFVVQPFLTIFQNPIHCGLDISCKERIETVTSWHARIAS